MEFAVNDVFIPSIMLPGLWACLAGKATRSGTESASLTSVCWASLLIGSAADLLHAFLQGVGGIGNSAHVITLQGVAQNLDLGFSVVAHGGVNLVAQFTQ